MKCSCDRRCHLSEVQHAGLRANWRSASGSAASINCLSRHVFGILMNCHRPDPSRSDAKPRASQAPLSTSPSSSSSGKSAIFRLALAAVRTKSHQDESLFRYLMGRVHYSPSRSLGLSFWCMVSRSDCPKLPLTAIIWLCFLQNESSNVVFKTSSVTSGVQFEVMLTADLLTLQGETTAFPPLELVCKMVNGSLIL